MGGMFTALIGASYGPAAEISQTGFDQLSMSRT
jgi:hypothetical protein